ncbi:PREDICTED: anthocyanidin 3-O-glucosyltransferase 2-like [Nicotiana attenuata]|uniref:UDP-glycosyltransferase g16288 n=1 Tax=Nicotiana attenuata TaxID=49451 RepID=A0A2I2MNE5_NICAT|nr:PREDICTED: anthocyanidin 3-O-glucosyltransferase 2-like [Nicotiana attenuata]AQQ16655.1 UDP-glycosyltransferase g16288 [Nicotiana attenuata]OIT29765.1 udp-glycosyltransferase 71k1 [Nicotiana attenuata]
MKKAKVVFISTPALGNLVPTIEFAKHLTQTNQNFSATILLINIPQRPLVQSYNDFLAATAPTGNVHFLSLPTADPPSLNQFEATIGFLSLLIKNHTSQVKDALVNLISDSDSSSGQVVGFFIDMFCTPFIDVAKELNIPCYLYFASPATFLNFMCYLPTLDAQVSNNTEFKDSATHFNILGFSNPVPVNFFPSFMLNRKIDGYSWFLHHARRYKETKGIVVNTFQELEPYCLNSLLNAAAADVVPPVYPIGPVLDHNGPAQWHQDLWGHENVMKWLDNQDPSSVVFLSFGSMGSLNISQVKEIAKGLEKSGHPFLWAIREAPKDKRELPNDYTNLEDILPCGFLEATQGKGLICGLVPQVTILAHKAIGGFVSHCGWNSILESLYYGVPIGTWPIYAEQHLNAFEMVKELNLAVEITMDYRDGNTLVLSQEVANGIKNLMDGDGEVRQRFKKMSEKCKQVWKENGSSSVFLGQLIDKLMAVI